MRLVRRRNGFHQFHFCFNGDLTVGSTAPHPHFSRAAHLRRHTQKPHEWPVNVASVWQHKWEQKKSTLEKTIEENPEYPRKVSEPPHGCPPHQRLGRPT